MKRPPPLSPALEAFLAPHREVSPLPPSVETRAMARAAAVVEWSSPPSARTVGPRPWVFGTAAATVVLVGAAAYAAHAWIGGSSPPSELAPSPAAVAMARPRAPRARVPALPEKELPAAISPEAGPRRRVMSRTNGAPMRTSSAELQLLRTARQEVTTGDYAEALTLIAEHARRFRNGSLVEEREALRVKALAGLGRLEDAQRAAAEFHARFPRSVLLPTFERMKGTDR